MACCVAGNKLFTVDQPIDIQPSRGDFISFFNPNSLAQDNQYLRKLDRPNEMNCQL